MAGQLWGQGGNADASGTVGSSGPGASPASAAVTRQALVERAARTWTDQLVDLSGRNGLLFYRDLAAGTLDLGHTAAAAQATLLAGAKVRLSALFPDPAGLADAARRCRKIRDKARENLEERGIETLYLASMLATWTPDAGTTALPAAPVLLFRVALTPMGAAAEDFELDLELPGELNPTLLYALASSYRVAVDPAAMREAAAGGPEEDDPWNPVALSTALTAACGPVPGFALKDRLVLGNFSYTKLPMVVDLQANGPALAAHDLVAAIAGDPGAQSALRARQRPVDPRELDAVPPAQERLVLDADSSQQAVIETVVRGSDAVIQGPPGTGKSQTISNLIASATALGLRVLFVAEKRAAIDAVIGRLDRVGLGDLVLDLHEGVRSKKQLAANIAGALEAARTSLATDATALQAQLAARRELLAKHAAAVNLVREPWGVSLYEAQARAIAAGPDAVPVRLLPATVDAMGADQLGAAMEDLRALLTLGVAAMTPAANPWSAAMTPVAPDRVEPLTEAALTLSRDAAPAIARLAGSVLGAAGVGGPRPAASIGVLATALAARATLDASVGPGMFEAATRLSPALEPARRGGIGAFLAGFFNGSYRAALAEARSLVRTTGGAPSAVAATVGEAAAAQNAWASIAPGPVPLVAGAADLLAAWNRAGGLVAEIATVLPAPNAAAVDLDGLAAWASSLDRDLPTLAKLPEIGARRASLAAAGLGELASAVIARGDAVDRATRALDGAWAAGIVERVLARDPVIGGLDAARLCAEEDAYRGLDREHIGSSNARVKREWAERAVAARDAHPEQDLLLSAEAKKKARHLSIRDLFSRAPDVLTAVKPCWAMSPLVVSQLLPGDRPYFDLVVFDEASQILPADAIPSLLRGHRAVVAGDELQLPPTTFFASGSGADTDDADDDEPIDGQGQALVRGFDSILGIADPLIGSKPLRLHYRSRDERLIAFSNLQIYRPKHRELTTFPAITDESAVRHVRVEPRLDRADGITSNEEVDAVVRLVLDHAATRPHESLGVIAMGINHAERVKEAVRLARADHPELDAYFAETAAEPFFVKNLERVQGDERDAIILTVGYGKTADGRLRHNFGPVNQQGGERRLNVAITRAKRRMTVVSSFGSEDVDPARSSAEGVRLLRAYLRYAETGGTDLGGVAEARPPLNGFERDVLGVLEQMGIGAVPQLGTSGYYLDFALRHPQRAGRYVLAVECDGANYHAAPNTRERDRLRQQQLEVIGWRFHRIWSTDWFRDRAGEAARLVAAYQTAVAEADKPAPVPAPAAPSTVGAAPTAAPQPTPGGPLPLPPVPTPFSTRPPVEVPGRSPKPRAYRHASIDETPQSQIDAVVRWIESDGQLRTEEEVVTEAIEVLGFSRRGAKIVAAIEASIARVRMGRGR